MKKKNSNPVGALKRTGVYMKSSLGVIALALVLAALSAVMTIIGPDKIGKMATIMSDGLFTGIDLAAIAKIGVFLAIIYCLSALFGFIQHYIMAVVTLKMSYRMRGELSEKINRVPQKYFNTTSQGDILSRITNDVSTLQQGLTNSLPTIKRYKETRRRHPLMSDGMTIEQAMHREQELLRPLREHADFVIDTTLMPAAKLRNELYGLFGDKSARGKLSVNVVSFGFKYGIPLEADLVFDVRFLPNPFYVPELKHKTGMDSEVYDYVFSFPQTKTFIDKLEGMLSFLLPLYAEEGKSTLVIAVGCTGGHHRSVSVARCIASYLTALGYPAFENHRDITRG